MPKQDVHDLLDKGIGDKEFRIKYNNSLSKDKFVAKAKEDGYDFTVEELTAVIRERGGEFDSYGNPPKKDIWD